MAAFRTALAVTAALATLASSVALAQSTVPDIVGHWDAVEGSGAIYTGNVVAEIGATAQIEVVEQAGYAFNGTFSWALPPSDDPPGHDGTEHTHQAEEDIMGVFTGDGGSFIIVEHPDTGIMFGRVLDHNRLEVVVAESGEFANVSRFVYERRQ
ncbi:MAG: hypothetical protein AAFX92_02730 [Pseudomonadota bacterium]